MAVCEWALAATVCVAGMYSVEAFGAEQMTLFPDAAAIHWAGAPRSLPRGTLISILAGDPSQAGPFVLRLKIAANTTIAPHTHSTSESVTVLSGLIVHETGRILSRSQGSAVAVGGFVYLPAMMPHSLWTTNTPAEIEVSGTGPFGLNYVNPADDPGRSK